MTYKLYCDILKKVLSTKEINIIRISKVIGVEILNFNELTSIEQRLVLRACLARNKAQAPYSNYHVGCSLAVNVSVSGLHVEDFDFYEGCNVERVSYTQTSHAEQNAIDTAIAARGGFLKISAIAIVGGPKSQLIKFSDKQPDSEWITTNVSFESLCPSCGHCLQCIAENCFNYPEGTYDPSIPLIGLYDRNNHQFFYRTTIGEAFPMPFLPYHLSNISSDSPIT